MIRYVIAMGMYFAESYGEVMRRARGQLAEDGFLVRLLAGTVRPAWPAAWIRPTPGHEVAVPPQQG